MNCGFAAAEFLLPDKVLGKGREVVVVRSGELLVRVFVYPAVAGVLVAEGYLARGDCCRDTNQKNFFAGFVATGKREQPAKQWPADIYLDACFFADLAP